MLNHNLEYVLVAAKYFNFSLYLVGMTCLMAVVVIAIHYQGNTRMPDWLYNIGIVRLSKITLVCVEHLNGVPAQVKYVTSMYLTFTFINKIKLSICKRMEYIVLN